MRHNPDSEKNQIRSSALWGKGSGGDSRSSALWGKGGRGFATLLIALVALTAVPVAATAEKRPASSPGQGSQGQGGNGPDAQGAAVAFVDPALRADARAHPGRKFRVVVQGSSTQRSLESAVKAKGTLRKRLGIITGAAVTLTGGRLLALAKSPYVESITRDSRMVGTATSLARPESLGTDDRCRPALERIAVPKTRRRSRSSIRASTGRSWTSPDGS